MTKVITISREYGSGGRFIGRKVAEKLGYEFYDKELIDMAAKESGLAPEFIEKSEQNISSSWLYNMMLGSSYNVLATGSVPGTTKPVLPLADQIFNAQRKVILKIAEEKPCVIVGRCADYIISTSEKFEKKDVLNVFVCAELEDKIERATKFYNVPENEAKKLIVQIDKRRANHYNTFTENIWGDRKNYELILNSSYFGVDAAVDLICKCVQ